MNKLILFLFEHTSEEMQAKIFFLVSTIVIGVVVNLIAGAIMRFMLRW
jgi:hypothetical protein